VFVPSGLAAALTAGAAIRGIAVCRANREGNGTWWEAVTATI
jgi:hypothetical protein